MASLNVTRTNISLRIPHKIRITHSDYGCVMQPVTDTHMKIVAFIHLVPLDEVQFSSLEINVVKYKGRGNGGKK